MYVYVCTPAVSCTRRCVWMPEHLGGCCHDDSLFSPDPFIILHPRAIDIIIIYVILRGTGGCGRWIGGNENAV